MIRTPVAPPKLLRFAEKVNGRCAMQGVTWGATDFAYTHHSITQQMSDPKSVLAAVSVAGAVTLGTAITAGILDNDVPETKPDSFWNAEAELINSRVAMAAFPVLAIATSFYSS